MYRISVFEAGKSKIEDEAEFSKFGTLNPSVCMSNEEAQSMTQGHVNRSTVVPSASVQNSPENSFVNGQPNIKQAEFVGTEGMDDPNVPFLKWCAFCARDVPVRVQYKNSQTTLLSSIGIFMLGGVFGCFLLPFFTNHFKDIGMYCTRCFRQL